MYDDLQYLKAYRNGERLMLPINNEFQLEDCHQWKLHTVTPNDAITIIKGMRKLEKESVEKGYLWDYGEWKTVDFTFDSYADAYEYCLNYSALQGRVARYYETENAEVYQTDEYKALEKEARECLDYVYIHPSSDHPQVDMLYKYNDLFKQMQKYKLDYAKEHNLVKTLVYIGVYEKN